MISLDAAGVNNNELPGSAFYFFFKLSLVRKLIVEMNYGRGFLSGIFFLINCFNWADFGLDRVT